MRKLLLGLLLLIVPAWGIGQPGAPEGVAKPISILIRGGRVVDGTGARARQADVRISGDAIEAVGRLAPRVGERVIEARGRVVAPGFIDAHSHADGGILDSPEAELPIRQGITTAIVGQDGGSHLPLRKWFEDIEAKHVALNFASFVGHGTVRREAMGSDYKRHTTPEEVARMQALVRQEMEAGALGLSSGLEYDPGFYSTTEELIALAQAAAPYGGLYISHVRDEQSGALTSFRELIRIAEEGHLPAQISHIKLGAAGLWGKAGEALRLIEDANKRGVDISADVYPYTYWSSTITAMVPTRNWEDRAIWEKGLADVGGPEHILLSQYTPDPAWSGKTIAEIAKMTGKDAVSVIQEVVRKTHSEGARGGERVVVTAMAEEDVRRFVAAPRIMFCTDGGLRGAHPRAAGSFPRILGRYVREQHALSLEEAIRKMTSLPASRMGFRDRGTLKPGMKADVVIFDPKTVRDTATIEKPNGFPVGLSFVLVNGQLVLDDGKITGARPGRALCRVVGARTGAFRPALGCLGTFETADARR